MPWHKVAEVQQVPQGSRKHVELAGREYMLLHTRDGLYCIDHHCPHADGPAGDGLVMGRTITCPLHKWRFDLTDGSHVHKGTRNLGVYQVRIEGNDVLIEAG